jgi:hypothetical protein
LDFGKCAGTRPAGNRHRASRRYLGETPRVANPTWREQKGWDHPFDNSPSMDLNTGHGVGAARFIFALGGQGRRELSSRREQIPRGAHAPLLRGLVMTCVARLASEHFLVSNAAPEGFFNSLSTWPGLAWCSPGEPVCATVQTRRDLVDHTASQVSPCAWVMVVGPRRIVVRRSGRTPRQEAESVAIGVDHPWIHLRLHRIQKAYVAPLARVVAGRDSRVREQERHYHEGGSRHTE